MPAVLSTGVVEHPAISREAAVSAQAKTTDNLIRNIVGTFLNQTATIISAAPVDADVEAVEETSPGFELRHADVAVYQHGQRLDKVLVDMVPEFSRNYLQQLIVLGSVALNGRVANKSALRVKVGDKLAVELRPTLQSQAFKAESIGLDVVFVDEHIRVINKPAGLVVHPAPGNWSGTLLNALLYMDAEAGTLPRAGIVHRLDKDTSGLMVIARSRQAMDLLVKAIASREVNRRYLAVAHGRWSGESEVSVDAPIGRDPRNRLRMAVVDLKTQSGKLAKTDIRLLENADEHCFVRCVLHTGRTHQIRVHMASLGHPLVADSVYGGVATHSMVRQALHAHRLSFKHPITGADLQFEAPLPADLSGLLECLSLSYNPSSRP